jgi:hypothetical protein
MLGAGASIVMGALSLGKNLADSIKANKQAKSAEAAAKQYAQDYKNIEEINYMAALQAPDISKMQQEEAARATQMSIQAMQEMGPEGAAQVGNIVEAQRQANLKTAQQQGILEQQVQQKVLGTQQQLEGKRAAREENVALMGLQGAQMAGIDAQNRKTLAVEGMFGAGEQIISGIEGLFPLYGKGKNNSAGLSVPGAGTGAGYGSSGASF